MRDIQRKAIESLYEGKCLIEFRAGIEDPETGITEQVNKVLVENEPCRLSYNSSNTMVEGIIDKSKQEVTLFIRPEIEIPAGSVIIVKQHGVTHTFKQSGVPKLHYSHQEVPLAFADKYGRYYD